MATQHAIGQVEEVARLLDAVVTVSASRIPVLLLGPRGSGINLLAKSIHAASPREARPLVVVRYGAGSAAGAEAKLLGSRGGGTDGGGGEEAGERGAKVHGGGFQEANGGTLFIEQIQNASASMQIELLRVITEGEYVDAGGITHRTDVRLVVSGWHDLKERVEQGRFRGDLYERLSRMVLELRKGSSDQEYILQFVELLCGHQTPSHLPRVHHHAHHSLHANGNELEAFRDRAWFSEIHAASAALHSSRSNGSAEEILLEALRRIGQRNAQVSAQQNVHAATAAVARCLETYEVFDGQLFETLVSQLQRTLIEKALIQCNGVLSRTAGMLGISTGLLQSKLRELGLGEV